MHVVSSADLLGLRALFERTFQCVTAHQNHTEFTSVLSVVAEQRGWSRVALR